MRQIYEPKPNDVQETQVISNLDQILIRTELSGQPEQVPVIYEDKHGLPVLHVSQKDKPEQQQPGNEELSILWHELLTPLTVIKGYTATLLNFPDSVTPEERQKYIQGIDSASDRVIRLLDDLRDISHLDKAQPMKKELFCITDLVQAVITDMQFQARDNRIKLLPFGRLPLVQGEPERIRQVLQNLIGNAIKYSRHNEAIEIEVTMVRSEREVRSQFGDAPPMKAPCVVVSVSDDSVGIPENDLENIFHRFYRVKNKLTKSVPGAGLGLYICKRIMENHGGAIWARNKYHQKGSIFRFSLPLSR